MLVKGVGLEAALRRVDLSAADGYVIRPDASRGRRTAQLVTSRSRSTPSDATTSGSLSAPTGRENR